MTQRRIQGLDGLRAVACLAVIASHSAFNWAYGGWIGVDIFFVLSGWIITGILIRERDTHGTIRLARFYARRATRLYPALLLTVFGCYIASRTGALPEQAGDPLVIVAALGYVMNIWITMNHNAGSLLAHTWSLALEEQFYLLWPLALIFTRTRRALLWIAGGAGLMSLTLMVAVGGQSLTGVAYYAPPARVWELLAGCLLALAMTARRVPDRVHGPLALGAALLAGAVMATAPLIDEPKTWQAVLGVVAALAFLATAGADTWITRVLSARPLAWFGERSYAGYLYHFPIMMSGAWVGASHSADIAAKVATIVALSGLSFCLVEHPTRKLLDRVLGQEPRRRSRAGGADRGQIGRRSQEITY